MKTSHQSRLYRQDNYIFQKNYHNSGGNNGRWSVITDEKQKITDEKYLEITDE